jgi:beta-glucosidase
MGAAFIKGLQGDGPAIDQDHVAATPKHFAAHGSPESGINISPVQTGPRELRTLYLPPLARESIILLRNEGDILPLDEHIGSIAVIGPNADAARTGNYSGVNDRLVTVLDGIRNRVPDAAVSCANGCGIYDLCSDGIAQAVEVAANAEVAILVVGECNEVCEEGTDQTDLDLPGVQMELVKAVAATGTPVVVVLMNGRPLSIPWIAQHVPAVLEVWYPGEEGGNAVADVLFGDHNPCGKLPVSLPRSVGHVPVFYNHKPSARGIYHKPGEPGRPGRDYVFSSPTPLYEFGFGLSYTRFSYSDLTVKPNKIASGGRVKITVTLRNTGKRAGAEVVQLYVNDVVSTVTTPVKVMRRFEKIHLKPGETTHVEFELTPSDLALLDDRMEWVVEPGEFEVMVGGLKEAFVVDL